ncbi:MULTISPECIES: glycerol-3-phosphate acyltransferase [Cyanophyceae]|uniref:glycerol-3-phosphate acyltransferase n=1 Tax=Cyanophyceae TaxID=3028117 RepID=UPI001682537C|nr:glycerol-3-phosphate acyltransferase [Trichocoleus sp. FACHB-69]MBD1932976.1 glycerol-3-phosphate acyltransferase [Trichocoleus sp. FACHB-69]
MTLTQVWGALLIFIVCPLLGGLPLTAWIVRALSGRQLSRLGTRNVSVSAAFYHGGRLAGILAVLSEALKGIAAVLLARAFFETDPAWELIALIALVMGRYWMARGAGTTNVVWGYVVHDPVVSVLVFIIGGIGFTLVRERKLGRIWVLILLPVLKLLLPNRTTGEVVAAIALSSIIAWIYQNIPDDLDLPATQAQNGNKAVFRFFRGDRAIVSLDKPLDANKVGQKAATLSQLKRWGYSVPMGWVLPPGDDPALLIEYLQPSVAEPLVVRSSAVGEDSEQSSAAGQYETILNVTSGEALEEAITRVLASYNNPAAVQYRRDREAYARSAPRDLPESSMSVLIQKQIRGAFSGVAFSRDPIFQQGDAVVIEALPGDATQVVSGQVTPEQYRVFLGNVENLDVNSLEVEGSGDVPQGLIREVAYLARQLERQFHGIPQDIEWSYDGQTLWLLQSRSITTLQPIWTRKIAAEVIPGIIRPLTWSINRPLTCGVWGEIFTLVLGERAAGLDFNETATLHFSHAYFNATLLGQIFLRMGLPPESLEFLTRGAKFSKPPFSSTVQNVPGLMRLLGRELSLEKDFEQDYKNLLFPVLTVETALNNQDALFQRIEKLLDVLKTATYYSILAPLSLAIRQGVWKVKDIDLDNSIAPEVASLRSLQELAREARNLLPSSQLSSDSPSLFATLAEIPDGQTILERFDQWLDRYGYLSEVATDIAVPTWKEDPHAARELFTQFLGENEPPRRRERREKRGWKVDAVQRRLDLKGKVTEVYSRLLAEVRWCFVALEEIWLRSGLLSESGDIFFLEFDEVRRIIEGENKSLIEKVSQLVEKRRSQLKQDSQLTNISPLVYGNAPPTLNFIPQSSISTKLLQGIGASPGQAEGKVKVIRNLQAISDIDRDTILVVPYTDSGWAALLSRAGGLIAEVGGRLSHGAIVAREYGIPAVMDIHNATRLLQDGQRVRIDGQQGIVEIL